MKNKIGIYKKTESTATYCVSSLNPSLTLSVTYSSSNARNKNKRLNPIHW